MSKMRIKILCKYMVVTAFYYGVNSTCTCGSCADGWDLDTINVPEGYDYPSTGSSSGSELDSPNSWSNSTMPNPYHNDRYDSGAEEELDRNVLRAIQDAYANYEPVELDAPHTPIDVPEQSPENGNKTRKRKRGPEDGTALNTEPKLPKQVNKRKKNDGS